MIKEILIQWHAQLMDIERIPVILLALLVCTIVGMVSGPLGGNVHPFIWRVFDTLFGRLGDRMNSPKRSKADLAFRGFMISAFVIVIAALIGKSFAQATIAEPLYGITQILLLSLLLTVGSVWFALLRLYFAMEQDKVIEGVYYAIAHSSRINLAAGDDFGVTRAAMGLSVRSFDKGLVAPALWFLIGGFPAACIYSALAMMCWRFGKNGLGNNGSSGFATVPLALERLMGFIPSLFTAAFITLATIITPTASIQKGVTAWLGHKNRAPYEQGGPPLSALAWALNVSLGGAAQDLSGHAIKGVWVGPEGATAQLDHKHLRRAIYINVIAHILFIAALLGAYMWGGVL
jgi:adenosylcobinamide-phosphate synthase